MNPNDAMAWLIECKVQPVPFAVNVIKKSKWSFSLQDWMLGQNLKLFKKTPPPDPSSYALFKKCYFCHKFLSFVSSKERLCTYRYNDNHKNMEMLQLKIFKLEKDDSMYDWNASFKKMLFFSKEIIFPLTFWKTFFFSKRNHRLSWIREST